MTTPALLDKVLLVLAPLSGHGAEAAFRKLVKLTGWDLDEVVGFDADAARRDVSAISDLVQDLARYLQQPPQSLDDFGKLLEDAGRAFDAVRDLRRVVATAGPAHLDDFARAFVEALVLFVWMHFSPATLALAELLGLVTAPIDTDPLPQLEDGGRVVRRPHHRVQFHFDKLGPLVRDPVAALRDEYFAHDALATTAGAHAAADKLFPRLARLVQMCGAGASYGLHPSVRTSGDAAVRARMEHMLAIYTVRDDSFQGLRLALSSAERGHRGLVVSPFGSIQEELSFGGFDVRFAAGGDAGGFLIGSGGVSLVGGARWTLDVAAESSPGPVEPPARTLGGAGGSGVTWKTLSAEAHLALAQGAPGQASILFRAQGLRFQLAPADGDGFLSRVLPSSMGAAVDVGFGWSNTRGLFFEGGAGLEGSWPIHQSIGPVLLDRFGLRLTAGDDGLALAATLVCGLTLGPLALIVDGVGLEAQLGFPASGGNLGIAAFDLAFKPPNGVALAIDSALVQGAGYLTFDSLRHQYSGAVQLTVRGRFGLEAIGLLTTRMPDGRDGFSLLVLGAARFPAIPVGFGFALDEIGVLVGIHRTLDVAALSGALAGGSLDAVLFPSNPAAMASLPDALDRLFPAKQDAHTIGLLAGFTWGPSGLARIELGVLYDTSAPAQLVALGRVVIERPAIRLQLLALGVVDFDRGELDLEAHLVESRVLGADLSGDAAMMVRWGDDPVFVLSIGGFHPAYKPPTEFTRRFRGLRRVTLRAHTDESVLRLSLQAYLAVTSNTVQMGARVDFGATVSALSVDGLVSFDALIQFDPRLHIDVTVRGSVALKVAGQTLVGASVEAEVIGPGAWFADGTATITVLWWDVDYDFTIGSRPAAPGLPTVDGAALVAAALGDAQSWGTQIGAAAGLVAVRRSRRPGGPLVFHPLDQLVVRQPVAPLGVAIDKLEAGRLAQRRSFEVTVTVAGAAATVTPTYDAFARARYVDMSDDEKLSLPSFEDQRSGVVVSLAGGGAVTAVAASWTYDEYVWTAHGLTAPAPRVLVADAAAIGHALATSAASQAPLRRTGAARYRGPDDARVQLPRGGP